MTSQYSGSSSMRKALRPVCSAAMRVLPLPPNRSALGKGPLSSFRERLSLPPWPNSWISRVLATVDQFAAKQAVFGIDTALKAIREHKKQNELASVVETPVELIVKK